MIKIVRRLAAVIVLMSIGFSAQAGHLFIQATTNSPILLTGGFGIDLPQLAPFEETGTSGNSNFNVEDFDSGDIMRVDIGGVIRVFSFDSMPSGWTASSNSITSSPNDPGYAALVLTPPFTWRIEALAGSFTVLGYRLYTSSGTVDGTNTGVINQTLVTASTATPVPIVGPWQLALLVLALIAVAALGQRRFGSGHKAS